MPAARSWSALVLGIHTPDRSGCPSAVTGAGALRFGLPSAGRGTPGVGVFSHWAETDAPQETPSASPNATFHPLRHSQELIAITIGRIGPRAQPIGASGG